MNGQSKPRRFRWLKRLLFAVACLVTLLVLFHAEENWRGERAWAAYREQLLAKGAQLDWAAFIPPRVPDDQNFAMTPFLAPLSDLDPTTGRPRETEALKRVQDFAKSLPPGNLRGRLKGQCIDLVAWRDAIGKPPAPDDELPEPRTRTAQERAEAAPVVLAALKPYEPVIEELRSSSRRPYCRFNLNYTAENPIGIQLPHFGPLRQIWRVLALRASAELALGRTAEAFEDLDMLLRTLGAAGSEFLVGHLVTLSGLDLATQVLWEGLVNHHWSDAQLRTLQTRLEHMDCLAGLHRALEAERAALGHALLDYLKKQPRELATLLAMTSESTAGSVSASAFGALLARLVPRGWVSLEQLNYNRAFEERLKPILDLSARRVHPSLAQQCERTSQEEHARPASVFWHHRVLRKMLLPAVAPIFKKSALGQTNADQAMIACALERYGVAEGKFPDSLDALVPRFIAKLPRDVISGGPLKYRRDGGGYVLYSVGWNETDDGGKIVFTTRSSTAQDFEKGDWVWQAPAQP
ncbi:MAG: hypothetical protein N2689_01165 [Verrucomicrobiae bacterium]|nr:hypothetical protein [Verrucomicrobiae bacterium]